MLLTTDSSVEYDPDDYVVAHINIKEREERRRIKELNKKLTQATGEQGRSMSKEFKRIDEPKDIIDVLHNRILDNPKVRLVRRKAKTPRNPPKPRENK